MRFWILLGLLTCFSPSSSLRASSMPGPSMLGPSNSFRERAQSFWRRYNAMSNSVFSRSRGRRSRSDLGRSNSGSFAPTNWPDPQPLTRTANYPAAPERRYHMTAQTPYESPSRRNTPNSPHWLDLVVSNLIRDNFGGSSVAELITGTQMSQPRLVEDIHYVDPNTGSSYQRQSWVTTSSNQPHGRERRARAEWSVYTPVQEDSVTLERRPSYNGRMRRHPRVPYLPFNPLPSPQGMIPNGVPPRMGVLPFETAFRRCPQRPREGNRSCEGGVCAMPQNNDPPDIPANDEDPDACCICNTNKKNMQLEPCNHEVCMSCTRTMKSNETPSKPFTCPFCRAQVTGWHPKP